MFKIYEDPDSPSKGGVFKICDEQESPNERACLGAGGGVGAAPPPNPPLLFEPCKVAESFWPKVLVQTHHASIVFANGGGLRPPQPPRCFKPCKLASKHVSVFGSYHASILFAKGGWAAPPF